MGAIGKTSHRAQSARHVLKVKSSLFFYFFHYFFVRGVCQWVHTCTSTYKRITLRIYITFVVLFFYHSTVLMLLLLLLLLLLLRSPPPPSPSSGPNFDAFLFRLLGGASSSSYVPPASK